MCMIRHGKIQDGVRDLCHLPEHHQRGEEESSGVGKALALNVRSRTVNGLEDGGVLFVASEFCAKRPVVK